MSKAGKILSIAPQYAIPGGQIIVRCEGFGLSEDGDHGCEIQGVRARMTAASAKRVLVIVPEVSEEKASKLYLTSDGKRSNSGGIAIGKRMVDDMHIVANPAVDPKDDSIVFTRSGSRGQELPYTLYRLETDGFIHEMRTQIMNPTGLAFDQHGDLYVTNRAFGEVCRITHEEEIITISTDLGIATGIAFDHNGALYVGDRSGTIFRIYSNGRKEVFASLEPSVSAYHLAFGPDDRLYATAPGLASSDAVYAIDATGDVEYFFRGFGRPQGLAFDRKGNLYIAACYRGRHGIVRIQPDGKYAESFVAGNYIVGLCFTREGEMIVATNDALYSLSLGIYGTLL